MDVNVAEHIVKETIVKALKGKTIIMPTHAVNFAEYADEIIVLKKGVIVRKGNFRDISETPEFLEVFNKSLSRKKIESKEDQKIDDEQKKVKETITLLKVKKSMKISFNKK